jgi:hypothetical protein
MKELNFFIDKENKFKYKLEVEGVPLNEVYSRVCFYGNDGVNLFFNSKLDEASGKCECKVPILEKFGEMQGSLVVETIAGKTFFKLYECPVSFKQSVKVSMSDVQDHDFFEVEDTRVSETKVSIKVPTSEKINETKK